MHGTADDVIPVSDASEYAALLASNRSAPFHLEIMADAVRVFCLLIRMYTLTERVQDHFFREPEQLRRLVKCVTSFVRSAPKL